MINKVVDNWALVTVSLVSSIIFFLILTAIDLGEWRWPGSILAFVFMFLLSLILDRIVYIFVIGFVVGLSMLFGGLAIEIQARESSHEEIIGTVFFAVGFGTSAIILVLSGIYFELKSNKNK